MKLTVRISRTQIHLQTLPNAFLDPQMIKNNASLRGVHFPLLYKSLNVREEIQPRTRHQLICLVHDT